MVIVPVLAKPELATTEKLTVPLPVPELPEVIVIHEALLTAVHPHPVCVVTFTLPEPPPAGEDALTGEMEEAQIVDVDNVAYIVVPEALMLVTLALLELPL